MDYGSILLNIDNNTSIHTFVCPLHSGILLLLSDKSTRAVLVAYLYPRWFAIDLLIHHMLFSLSLLEFWMSTSIFTRNSSRPPATQNHNFLRLVGISNAC